MEILSNATFRGDVAIEKSLLLGKSGTSSYIGGNLIIGCTQLSPAIGHASGGLTIYNGATFNGGVSVNDIRFYGGFSICSDSSTIKVRSASITFPSTSGTLALTSQIPTVPSVAGFLKYKKVPIDFNVPADCTVFNISENSGNYISDYQVISIGLFKTESPYEIGYGYSFAIKQVQADVLVTCNANVVVEKSSAFAIGASDGYKIRAAYYE